MWGGFALFWEISVVRDGAPLLFMLWGIPFVLVGVYLIAGRFFADAWQRGRTYYGLTNERVLIVSGMFQRQVKSLALRGLRERSAGLWPDPVGPASPATGLVARDTSLVSVIFALLLGAASHSAWDSFTHAQAWAVQRFPALSTAVQLGALGDVRIFKILQHGSTIAGLISVAAWVGRWLERQSAGARAYSGQSEHRAIRILALLIAAGAAVALLNGLRGISRGIAAGLGCAAVGGMAALLIAFVVFGLMTRPRNLPRPAT